MAGKAVMSCEGLSSFTAGGFELKRALTRLPLENTTCPRFTLGPDHSCSFHSSRKMKTRCSLGFDRW